ncbi:MAG: hypothetical protein Q8S20_07120 [Sulfuritalea sp.]|nr:hypothetical protein [Sulfuritalea sp.]
MTFRIDQVSFDTRGKRPQCGRVIFDIKGIDGRGEYGRLCAAPDGLFLEQRLSGALKPLVPSFRIPAGADTQAASRILAETLHTLGWGPEVDQAGHVVDSKTYVLQRMRI